MIGLGVAAGLALPIAALAVVAAGFLIGLHNWRLSTLLLLAYLPVSGLLSIALFPQTAPGVLAKDFLFVLPAYAGFFAAFISARRPVFFWGPPWVPLALLSALVLFQAFNPSLPSMLVGLVGIKVWLFYIPLLFVGYHLIETREDLERVLKVVGLTAIIPATVGILEAILIYGGKSSVVYSLYGDAAATATQGFAELNVGGSQLRRVPSTFSFVAQYYIYITSMVAILYGWWRMAASSGRPSNLRLAIWLLVLVAVFTSGSRGAFVFVPMLLVAMLVIEGRVGLRPVGVAGAAVAGIFFLITLIGTDIGALSQNLYNNASIQLTEVVLEGVRQSADHVWAGLGTGADTAAARYVYDTGTPLGQAGGWQESWWVKSALELGAAGFLLSVIVYGGIIARGLQSHRRLRDPGLRALSAGIIALVIWLFAYNFKAQYGDFDPLNVYLWLFVGILFKLPNLDRQETDPDQRSRIGSNRPRRAAAADPRRVRGAASVPP